MKQEEKHITRKIIKARESIRRKNKLLKGTRAKLQSDIEISAQPFLKPLQDLTSSLRDRSTLADPSATATTTTTFDVGNKSTQSVGRRRSQSKVPPTTTTTSTSTQASDPLARQIVFDEGDSFTFEPELMSTQTRTPAFSKPSRIPTSKTRKRHSSEGSSPLLSHAVSTPEGKREVKERLQEIPAHVRPYVKLLFTGKAEGLSIDREYGPRVQPDGRVTLGKSDVSITPHFIIVGGEQYPGTKGLLDLIFLQDPTEGGRRTFDKSDLDMYKQIVKKTNLARIGFSRSQPYNKTGEKYTTLLKSLLQEEERESSSASVGEGLFNFYTSAPYQYVPWNDPNELVDRLRHLIASYNAGNLSHQNEINAILEELEEEGLISL